MSTATEETKKVVEETCEHGCECSTEANRIIKGNMFWAMGLGLIHIPILDAAAIAAVQVRMIASLANHYGIKFSEHRIKNLLGVLVGTLGMAPVNSVFSLVKFIPIVGPIAGALTVPVTAGATTYALGHVFNAHFATGGTLLDFDPKSMESFFQEKFEEGKKIASDMKKAAKA